MRVLGIDPGLSLTGYGCMELADGEDEPRLIEAGVLRLKSKTPMPYRLAQLHHDLGDLLEQLQPDLMVVEQLFSHYRHVRTSILMGHARGVVLLAAQLKGVELDELLPTEVKKAITGHGHASKIQMQQAIMVQCRLSELPSPPDVADAIAIANSAIQAIGCLGMRACNTNNCPVGIATQRKDLRARLIIHESAQRLNTFLRATTDLMCVLARACGHSRLDKFSRDDLTTFNRDMAYLSGVPYGGLPPIFTDPQGGLK